MQKRKNHSLVKLSVLLLFILCLFLNTRAQSFYDTTKKIDELFSHWTTTTPGGVISVSRNGKLLYRKAFGMADLEHNVINTTETIFEAGSVSKQFTAAAVLLLVQEGKLGLQDDIRKHFPGFPDYGTPITVEHLLHHTSGLRDWGSVIALSGWPRGTREYTPEHVKEIIWRQKALNFTPGSQYSYSNSNYNMLVFLVEKAGGTSFQKFTHDRLFEPLGMTHTQWRDNYRNIVPNRSVAYNRIGLFYRQTMPVENTFGHGALLTTADDLEKWNRRWTQPVLGEEINKLQQTTVRLTNGKPITYAAGVVVDKYNGLVEISHSGATAGYRAWLGYYPAKELSVVYLSNDGSTNPVQKGYAVARIFIGTEQEMDITEEIRPVAVSTQNWKNFAGLYKSVVSEDIQEFIFKNDSLRFKNYAAALQPMAENSFFLDGFQLTFTNSNHLQFRNPLGDSSTYKRVQPFDPGEKELQAFTGLYYSEEADARVELQATDGRLYMVRHGNSRTMISPVFTDAFKDFSNAFYEFVRDRKKKITGFKVSVGRAREVWFERLR